MDRRVQRVPPQPMPRSDSKTQRSPPTFRVPPSGTLSENHRAVTELEDNHKLSGKWERRTRDVLPESLEGEQATRHPFGTTQCVPCGHGHSRQIQGDFAAQAPPRSTASSRAQAPLSWLSQQHPPQQESNSEPRPAFRCRFSSASGPGPCCRPSLTLEPDTWRVTGQPVTACLCSPSD